MFLDESTDCPHLVVGLDRGRNLSAIITFGSGSVPGVCLREGERLERIEIDPGQWAQGRGDLTALMAALRGDSE